MIMKRLLSFVALVKHKNFTKAAEELFISQPTLSAHIQQLEEDLNQQLIIRTTRNIQVTPQGYELFECAQKMILLQEDLLKRWHGTTQKVIRIGSSTIPAGYILPNVLTKFSKIYPNVIFKVHQSDSTKILQGLKQGEYDIVFSGMPCREELVRSMPFYQDEMLVITPNTPYYAHMLKSNFGEWIEQVPIVLREEGSASQKKVNQILDSIGVNRSALHVVAKVNEPEAIKNFVSKGFGVSIISKIAVEDYVKTGKVLSCPISKEIHGRNLYIMHPQHAIEDEYTREFVNFVVKEYQ